MPPRNAVDETIDEVDGKNSAVPPSEEDNADDGQPMYQVFEESRIPVSKKTGALWKDRVDVGVGRYKSLGHWDAWEEAISYYKNDQTGKKNRGNPSLPNAGQAKDITGGFFTNTENVVFSNVSAMVPSIYAKNPDVTVHSNKSADDTKLETCLQKLIRVIMQKRAAPGVNLKPKMRRAVVMTTLTNLSYIEVGYTKREQSQEGTIAEIGKLAEELQNATDVKTLREVEGKLQALDDKVDLLQPSGPWCVFRHPKDVVVDPDASLVDNTDARWVAIKDSFPTDFLNAVYRRKTPNGMESIYKPTHVLKAASSSGTNIAGHDDTITNFHLLKEGLTYKDYGFDSETSYKAAQRTYVWKIWDRTTRRIMWYAENDWKWPIWVWDDPYGFDDFFPLAPLAFHTDPEDQFARGEASYYLDQQDEINVINSQVAKMRWRVANMLIYNKNAIKNEEDVRKLTRPVGEETVLGVSVPEGMKVQDMLSAPPIPTVDYAVLFDKKQLFDAVDRVSGVPAVVKGVEFRTNTTNKAIDSYESTSALRLDEKIDAIEECIGRIGSMLLILCLVNMDKETVSELIGEEHAAAWPGPIANAREASKMFSLTVTGGSSLKPTSKVRKEQAKEIAGVLGQFGANNPAVILVVLKALSRAYSDEIVLEPSDWEVIIGSLQQMMQPQEQPAAPGGPQQPPANDAGGAPQPGGGGQPDPRAIVQMVSELFRRMPDDVRKGVGMDIAKGVPLEEILGKLQNTATQGQPEAA
jgi:hypothetical protein